MKVIKDIRIYKSEIENIDGKSLPNDFMNKDLNVIIHRIVMKLRELSFSFGEFDHLYINFTVCLQNEKIRPAKRKVDQYHPWYRYYDVGVSHEVFQNLEFVESKEIIIDLIERVLLRFAADEQTKGLIKESISVALTQGDQMLMRYKEKKSAKNSAVVFLRYLDSGIYEPIVCVYDNNGQELMRRVLPQTLDLLSIGDIQLSSKRVTIKPRENVFTKDLEPVTFEITL